MILRVFNRSRRSIGTFVQKQELVEMASRHIDMASPEVPAVYRGQTDKNKNS